MGKVNVRGAFYYLGHHSYTAIPNQFKKFRGMILVAWRELIRRILHLVLNKISKEDLDYQSQKFSKILPTSLPILQVKRKPLYLQKPKISSLPKNPLYFNFSIQHNHMSDVQYSSLPSILSMSTPLIILLGDAFNFLPPSLLHIETLKIQLLLDYYRRDRWYSHGFLPVSLDNGMASFSVPFFRFNFFRIIKKGERFARSQCVVTHMFRRFRILIMCPISII